jgi:hypothetical protein
VPIDNTSDKNNTLSKRIQEIRNVGFDIREQLNRLFQNKLTTPVIDQSLYLTVELKNDSRETF